jgi:Thiamine pyrophosphate enzyme, N-terminal TPP binding domain
MATPAMAFNGILGALDRALDRFQFVQVRHEEEAAFMATAHAKFTGEVGVCLATSGPGAIHLLNGLYDAKLDHQPDRRRVRSAAHPLRRSHEIKCLVVVRHDIVFRAMGHFFLQAVPLDGLELVLGEQREALGIAHLRHGIVGAFGEGDRVGNLRRLDVLQELQRER